MYCQALSSSKLSKVETRNQEEECICQALGCGTRIKVKNARNHAPYHRQHDSKLVGRVGIAVPELRGFCASNKAIQIGGGDVVICYNNVSFKLFVFFVFSIKIL